MSRIITLAERLPDYGVDHILIARPVNTAYLSGFTAMTYSRPVLAVIGTQNLLIVPELEREHAQRTSAIDHIYTYTDQQLGATAGHSPLELALKTVSSAFGDAGVDVDRVRLGFEADYLSYQGYRALQEFINGNIVPIVGAVEQGRLIKDAEEIELLSTSCKIADIGMEAAVRASIPGTSELEIAACANREMAMAAGQLSPEQLVTVAAQPVAGVDRTVLPHAITSHYRLENRDVVLHGTGGSVGGYHCEVERSMFTGEPTTEQIAAFQAMVAAQSAGIAALWPGTRACAVDQICRDVITDAGYGELIVHRSGHGMGLVAHEAPHLAQSDDTVLASGMVVTVEPGIYLHGVGGFRHSDTVLITDDGPRLLTRYPRHLEALVRSA